MTSSVNQTVSVIIPIYNVEKFLSRCVSSIINQTYSNLQIILVNDGSTDSCINICNNFKAIDNRITVIDKQNEGLSSARNAGLSEAKGDYVIFVDSDDWVSRTMVQDLIDDARSTKADIVICNYYFATNTNSFSKNKITARPFIVNNDSKYENLYNKIDILTTVSWNKLYKKEIFHGLKFKEGVLNEDEFIICELLNKAKIISYRLDLYLYFYYQRQDSIMHSFSMKRFDILRALQNRASFFNDDVLKFKNNYRLAMQLVNLISLARLNKIDKKNLLRYYNELIAISHKLKQDMRYGTTIQKIKIIALNYLPFSYINLYTLIKGKLCHQLN